MVMPIYVELESRDLAVLDTGATWCLENPLHLLDCESLSIAN